MAKRKATRRPKPARKSVKRQSSKRPAARARKAALRRPAKKKIAKKSAKSAAKKIVKKAVPAPSARRPAAARGKTPRLDRVRRRLEEEDVPTPPSSLNMNRNASAARSGRAEMAQELENHRGMSPDIAGGDVDVDVEDAYFTGDEAPGGDNPTPDQDIVDDIGKALGVQYGEGEELKSTDKITERDKHRWEMDPASSEDYKQRR